MRRLARPTVLSPDEAAELIEDGATVTVSGLAGNLVPEPIIAALEARFMQTGHPCDLTEIHPWVYGGPPGVGLDRWAHPGLLRRIIGSTYILPSLNKSAAINAAIIEDRIPAHCWPANAIFQMLRAVGAGRMAYTTTIGIGTFADPRVDGGRLNPSAESDLISLVDIAGEEHLCYHSIPIDVAIIRASTADEAGNLCCEDEGLTQGILVQATAARNSGGIVIAQVRRIVSEGSQHPLMVEVPGHLVDYIVVVPEGVQWEYNLGGLSGDLPATTGRVRQPLPEPPVVPMSTGKLIARRALCEIEPQMIVNIGGGIPTDYILNVAHEEGISSEVAFSIEHGVFGGWCMTPVHWNPHVITSPAWLLDFYNGGGLDHAFLSMGEVDRHGNVNVGRLGAQLPGPGGFTDIATGTRAVTFVGTFTGGGLLTEIRDEKLVIVREGTVRKFVPDCQMICFSGAEAQRRGQVIRYVTERVVLRLTERGLVVEEIAPGIDLQSQVLDQADIELVVASDLRTMPAEIFSSEVRTTVPGRAASGPTREEMR